MADLVIMKNMEKKKNIKKGARSDKKRKLPQKWQEIMLKSKKGAKNAVEILNEIRYGV